MTCTVYDLSARVRGGWNLEFTPEEYIEHREYQEESLTAVREWEEEMKRLALDGDEEAIGILRGMDEMFPPVG